MLLVDVEYNLMGRRLRRLKRLGDAVYLEVSCNLLITTRIDNHIHKYAAC